jgi:hypothetical protein
MSAPDRPYRRKDYAGALVANALASPFNIVLLVATMGGAVLVGAHVVVALLVALVVYAIACVRTFFDAEEAEKVLERERAERRAGLERGRKPLALESLAPEVAEPVRQARRRDQLIRDAIERAELPYEEVTDEVEGFLEYVEASARRAQMLYEVLRDNPPDAIRRRLAAVGSDPSRRELVEALRQQLTVAERCERQLQRYHDETERMLVEMDTIRAHLVSLSASTDASNQQRLAAEVRSLREEMSALADGMSEAFESHS